MSVVVGRLGLTSIAPVVAGGRLSAKSVVGEHVPVSAVIFREGHDAVAANVALRGPEGARIRFVPMTPGAVGTDQWHATIVLDREGEWTFVVEAWSNPMATWKHNVTVKIDAGQGPEDLANDLEIGVHGETLTSHVGVFATTGMGKSNLMKVLAGQILASQGRYD